MRDYSFTLNTAEFAVLIEMLEESVERSKQNLYSTGLENQEVEPEQVRSFIDEVEARQQELELRKRILEIVKKEKL